MAGSSGGCRRGRSKRGYFPSPARGRGAGERAGPEAGWRCVKATQLFFRILMVRPPASGWLSPALSRKREREQYRPHPGLPPQGEGVDSRLRGNDEITNFLKGRTALDHTHPIAKAATLPLPLGCRANGRGDFFWARGRGEKFFAPTSLRGNDENHSSMPRRHLCLLCFSIENTGHTWACSYDFLLFPTERRSRSVRARSL